MLIKYHTQRSEKTLSIHSFIDVEEQSFPIRCIPDLQSTLISISPETATAFRIPVMKRVLPETSSNVREQKIMTKQYLQYLLVLLLEITVL